MASRSECECVICVCLRVCVSGGEGAQGVSGALLATIPVSQAPLLPFPTGGRLGVRLRSPGRPKHFHHLQRPPPACSRIRPRSPSRRSWCSPTPPCAGS